MLTPSNPALNHIRTFLGAALTLLIPVECAGCRTADTRFCDRCRAELEASTLPAEHQFRPVDLPFPVFAATEYQGLVRTCIINFKESGRTDLAQHLAASLNVAFTTAREYLASEVGDEPLHCIPVPSTRAATGDRGYNHVELLMRSLPSRPKINRWLVASPNRRDQVGLSVTERAANAATSIAVRGSHVSSIRGKNVVLIDDLTTTGSTLGSASTALRAAGARVVAAIVIAHTPKLW